MMLEEIKQLVFDFAKGAKSGRPFRRIAQLATEPPVEAPSEEPHQGDATGRRDAKLEAICHELLAALGMSASSLLVTFNALRLARLAPAAATAPTLAARPAGAALP